MRVSQKRFAASYRRLQAECVDEAVALIVSAGAAFGPQIPAIVRLAEIIFGSKQRRRVVDSVPPGVGTVHGQQRVEADLSGYDESVKGRVSHEACDRRAGPLREGKDLLVGRLRAAQTLVSDNDRRFVGVHVYAE